MSQKERSINQGIADRLNALIKSKGITPYQLMKELEIPSATFYNCMNSERDWSIEKLIKLSDYFDVTLDWLIRGFGQKLKLQRLEKEKEEIATRVEESQAYIKQAAELIRAAEKKIAYGKKKE